LRAVRVLDDQLAAVILLRRRQEQRRRQVRAHRLHDLAGAVVPDGIVDVETEGLATTVAVEQRRKHHARQRRGEIIVVGLERAADQRAELDRHRVGFGQLLVVLGLARLVARGDAAVGPRRGSQSFAAIRDLFGAQNLREVQQHGGVLGTRNPRS